MASNGDRHADAVDHEELIEFLREQRDEYREMADSGRENDDPFAKNYGVGRYHAYTDILAWMYAEGMNAD